MGAYAAEAGRLALLAENVPVPGARSFENHGRPSDASPEVPTGLPVAPEQALPGSSARSTVADDPATRVTNRARGTYKCQSRQAEQRAGPGATTAGHR